MNRKIFLKTSGLGLGLFFFPKIVQSQTSNIKNTRGCEPKIIKNLEGDVLNVIGDIQTHKLIGSETGSQIVEWGYNVELGVGIPSHIHTLEDEKFRVVKGQVEIMVGNKTTILNEGDVAFAPKNIAHSWKVDGTEKAKMITSAFPAGIEFMFKASYLNFLLALQTLKKYQKFVANMVLNLFELNLFIPKTSNFVVIHHTCSLHVCINNRTTNKFESAFF